MMGLKKILLTILFCLISSWAFAATHLVTEAGGGGNPPTEYSQAELEALNDTSFAGDTFYFSGSFSSDIELDPGFSGTDGNQVIFDGYEAGNCEDVWTNSCASGADVKGITVNGNDYITFEDFDFQASDQGFNTTDSALSTGLIVKHNHFNDSSLASIILRLSNNSIVFNNRIDKTSTYSCIEMQGGHGNKIVKNDINGDGDAHTGILTKAAYSQAGAAGQTKGNIIAGNNISGISEECISFDIVNDADEVTCLEADTVSSSATNTITLSAGGWATAGSLYADHYMVFLSGSLAGQYYKITAHTNAVFTFTETVSSAGNGDRISIALPFMYNYIGYNTVSNYGWNYSSGLLYGTAFGNIFEGHYDVEASSDEAILFQTHTDNQQYTGNITGNCGICPAFNNLAYNNTINNIKFRFWNIPSICEDNPAYFRSWYNTAIDNTLAVGLNVYYQNYYASGANQGTLDDDGSSTNNSIYAYSFPYIYGTPVINANGTITINWSENVDLTSYTNGDSYLTTDTDIETEIPLNNPTGSASSRTFSASTVPTPGQTYKLWFDGTAGSIINTSGNSMIVVGFKPITNNATTDTTPPTISGASPSGEQVCTSDPRNVTMSWTTSETANCRISATDEAYASMDADSVTNTDSTTHSDVESFACDASYHRYVACVDPSDNETAARTDISFSIDTGAPPDPSTVGSSTGGGSSGGSM